jgi:hypothetical protein
MLPNGRWFTTALNWLGVKQVNWDFFVSGEPKVAENFEVWFYSHYMLSFNLGLGLLLLIFAPWWRALGSVKPKVPLALVYVLAIAGVVLLYDALRLRSCVADISVQHSGTGTDRS